MTCLCFSLLKTLLTSTDSELRPSQCPERLFNGRFWVTAEVFMNTRCREPTSRARRSQIETPAMGMNVYSESASYPSRGTRDFRSYSIRGIRRSVVRPENHTCDRYYGESK